MHSVRRHRSAAALAAFSLAGALALTGCGAGSAGDKSAARPAAADKAPAAGPQEDGAARAEPGAGAAAPSAAADAKGQPQPAPVRAHVIRTATLAIETAEPQKALATARTEAERAGGYVGNESTGRGKDGLITSTVTLRVPGERFDAVIGSLEGGGKLLNRKIETQDVAERVADVDSRVKSQQASVVRVREMMDRASALSDVVMLEGELSRRQSDLESLLAQQSALKDQTSLGTITLSVSEPAPKAAEKEKEEKPGFTDALHGGWEVFATLVRYLVLAIAAVLPFAIAAALVVFGFRAYRRLRPAKPRPAPVSARVPVQGASGPWATPAPPAGAPAPVPARAKDAAPAETEADA